ncbi:MAG: NEAT domain-containing protein [Eubacteriales bacterium]
MDKDNLPDGTYSIYGEMIKMNRQEKSMSNDAINHYIKLTVENGQYYLTMDFKGLSSLNRFGYLAELSLLARMVIHSAVLVLSMVLVF